MHRTLKFVVAPVLGAAFLFSQAAFSQARHDNSHYVRHSEWHKGARIAPNDWNRGDHISNWSHYHLSRPPRGYEWRRVDGNYVLAAVATGVIASVVVAAAAGR